MGVKIFVVGLVRSFGVLYFFYVGVDFTIGIGVSERGIFNLGIRIKLELVVINKLIFCITRIKFYLCFWVERWFYK